MKKGINIIIGLLLSLFVVYFIAINFINIVVFHKLSWTLDLRLLFFNDQWLIFSITTLLVVLGWSEVIINNLFGKNSKRWLTKDEKSRVSHLSSLKEIKPYLIKVTFDDTKFIETKNDLINQTVKNKKWKKSHSLEKNIQDTYKNLFKSDKVISIPFLSKYNFYHPVLKQYSIGSEKKYKRGGLVFSGGKNYMYVDPADNHTLVLGTSNSGKSWSLVLEMLEAARMAGESVIVNDPKGELTKYMKKKYEDDGYQCWVLNFVDPQYSNCWNPFELAWEEWLEAEDKVKDDIKEYNEEYEKLKNKCKLLGLVEPERKNEPAADYSKAIEMVMDVANTLCVEPNAKDPIWSETARDMMAGAACFFLENHMHDQLNFTNIGKLIADASRMIKKNEDPLGMIKSQTKLMRVYLDRYRTRKDKSVELLDGFLSSEDSTQSSFYSQFRNKMSVVTQNEAVEKILASNNIDLKSIGEKKTAIFLIVHDEKKTYYPLSTMFVKQVYETLIKSARNEANLRLKVPINMILDEFGNMPPVKDIDSMLTAARSRGIRITMIIQDYGQLDKQYGKDMSKTIKGNVMNTVYLLSGDNDTLEEISKRAGTEKVWNKDTKKYEDVRLFSKDRLQTFKMGEALFLSQRKYPYFTKLPQYSDYVFYKDNLESEFDRIPKPDITYYNLWNDFLRLSEADEIAQETDEDTAYHMQ